MPKPQTDYFRYFPLNPAVRNWGIAVTAAGHTRIAPFSPYPPSRHPEDHQFDWGRGRVLEAVQIVLITQGRGEFEAGRGPPQPVEAGMAFVLLPKVWHRYRPDPASGWEESWIEVQGPIVDRLRASRVLTKQSMLRRDAVAAGLDIALEAVHARARKLEAGFDPDLSAAALGVLAAWERAGQAAPSRSRMTAAIKEAERRLTERFREPVNVAELARSLGVAYSHFRRGFKEATGYSPWQYVLRLRLGFARRLLSSSDVTLDEAASQLGFGSGFHLSRAFKQMYGVAPDPWRRSLRLDR